MGAAREGLNDPSDSLGPKALSGPRQRGRSVTNASPELGRRRLQPILIVVNAHRDDFTFLKRALWKTGATARVWWAQDVPEALRILSVVEGTGAPVCIISDLQLPGCGGIELLGQMRSRPASGRIRFVILTGAHDPQVAARALDSGADAYFVKPSRPADLYEIARALQKLASH